MLLRNICSMPSFCTNEILSSNYDALTLLICLNIVPTFLAMKQFYTLQTQFQWARQGGQKSSKQPRSDIWAMTLTECFNVLRQEWQQYQMDGSNRANCYDIVFVMGWTCLLIVTHLIKIYESNIFVLAAMCLQKERQFKLFCILAYSLQMIKQSQIRNFISLIARTKIQTATSNAQAQTVPQQLRLSNKNINKCRRYQTEPVHNQNTLQNSSGCAEESTKHYVKLSLYEKYRRSLQNKKNHISLKNQCIVETDKQKQLEARSKEVVFPVNRPTQRSSSKQHSICRQRILSTPSHLHFHRALKTQNMEQRQERLPCLSPQNLTEARQQVLSHFKPMFKVRKYQPLNFQTRIDQAHRVCTQQAKMHHQQQLYAKIRLQDHGRRAKRMQDKREKDEVLEESVSAWIVDKAKSRFDYEP